jgi:hypothetical protein
LTALVFIVLTGVATADLVARGRPLACGACDSSGADWFRSSSKSAADLAPLRGRAELVLLLSANAIFDGDNTAAATEPLVLRAFLAAGLVTLLADGGRPRMGLVTVAGGFELRALVIDMGSKLSKSGSESEPARAAN